MIVRQIDNPTCEHCGKMRESYLARNRHRLGFAGWHHGKCKCCIPPTVFKLTECSPGTDILYTETDLSLYEEQVVTWVVELDDGKCYMVGKVTGNFSTAPVTVVSNSSPCGCSLCSGCNGNPEVIVTLTWTDSDAQKDWMLCRFLNGSSAIVCGGPSAPFWNNGSNLGLHFSGQYVNFIVKGNPHPTAVPNAVQIDFYDPSASQPINLREFNIASHTIDTSDWPASPAPDSAFGQMTSTDGVTYKWERGANW